jgi:hypothetical protein
MINLGTNIGRRFVLVLAVALATVGLVVAMSSGHTRSKPMAAMSGGENAQQLAFHDAMRELWEFHGAWTRMAIDNFVGGNPDFAATAQTLLQNQVDIGNAVKPYYGAAAGHKLTVLLKAHINGAVAVLEAAKSANANRLASAEKAWFANGNQIAGFLHSANPHNWSLPAMRSVIKQAVDELHGNYAASARDFNAYNQHLLMMADMLSSGIMEQFPARFR